MVIVNYCLWLNLVCRYVTLYIDQSTYYRYKPMQYREILVYVSLYWREHRLITFIKFSLLYLCIAQDIFSPQFPDKFVPVKKFYIQKIKSFIYSLSLSKMFVNGNCEINNLFTQINKEILFRLKFPRQSSRPLTVHVYFL